MRPLLRGAAAGATVAAASLLVSTVAAPASASAPSLGARLAHSNIATRLSAAPAAGPIGALRAALTGDAVLDVRYASPAAARAVRAAVSAAGGYVRHDLAQLGVLAVAVPPAGVTALRAALAGIAGVRSVAGDHARHPLGDPSDPMFAQQGYLGTVRAPDAWAAPHTAVPIAVIDTGVDVDHPDLAGKVAAQYNAVDGSSDVTDDDGHGTMVAGIAAAATDNGVGIAGAGDDATIIAVKVADANGAIAASDVANGITWATDHGARVIDLSIGGSTSDSTENAAVSYAEAQGVVVVAAAGNAGNTLPEYPAATPGVIAVGATDGAGARLADSNYGSWVTVGAPGAGIVATVPASVDATGYQAENGTSFAAPIVAGEAALLAGYGWRVTGDQVRSAILDGADQDSTYGFARGQVDFATALADLPPPQAPVVTAPTAGKVSGSVSLAATSAAPSVQFLVDGTPYGAPVATTNGSAALSWSTWGLVNGSTHMIAAEGCALLGCGPASDPAVMVDVDNVAPVLTSPTSGQLSNGTVQLAATAAGGGVAFYIDDVRRAFDGAAPYAATVSLNSVADGTHTAYAVSCDATGATCDGPSSATVKFTTKSLHPRITSIAPSPFSPNGDGRRDTTKITYYLPEGGSAGYVIRNAAGQVAVARGLGTLAPGWHNFIWKGRNALGNRVKDGTLTVTINVTKVVSGVTVKGTAARTVRVDDSAPTLSSVSGGGTTIYPYRDGYRDAFTPAVTVGEAATLTLEVRNSAGALVRTLTASHSRSGRFGILWGGRTASGRMVPAGTYHYAFVAADLAGNRRSIGGYRVYVSAKRLVSKTATLARTAMQADEIDSSNLDCAGASVTQSSFANGVWFANFCDPSVEDDIVIGYWHVTVPPALRYGTLRIGARGFTTSQPTALVGAMYNVGTGDGDVTGVASLGSSATQWWGLGQLTAAGHVSYARVVNFAVALPNLDGVDEFDMASVRLVVTYSVLQ